MDAISTPEQQRDADAEYSQLLFAAAAATLTEEEQREYARVLDAALSGGAGDRALSADLFRQQLLEEPRVTEIHLRVERLWLALLGVADWADAV